MGTGYVMSGGTVYDPRSSPTGDLASYYEWDSLDPYFGHSDNNFQYHYHAVPALWGSSADSSVCEHIGYMIDGGKLMDTVKLMEFKFNLVTSKIQLTHLPMKVITLTPPK